MKFHTRIPPSFGVQHKVPTVGNASIAALAPGLDENALNNRGDTSDDTGTTVQEDLENTIEYTLTIPEAQQRIIEARRKAPSDRSIQRYTSDSFHILKGMNLTYSA